MNLGERVSPLQLDAIGDAPEVARAVLALLPDAGIMLVDTEMRVGFAGGSVFERHGLTARAMLERRLSDVLPAAAWEMSRTHWQAAILGVSRSMRWPSTDGLREYHATFAPVIVGERVEGAVLMIQDITAPALERRALERRVVQQQAVSRMGAMLLEEAPFDHVARVAAEELRRGLGATSAMVLAHDDETGLRVLAGAGAQLPPPKPADPAGRPQVFQALRGARRALLIGDLGADGQLEAPVLQEAGMASLVAAPTGMRADDFGLVGAVSPEKDAFSTEDLAFVESVAHLVTQSAERERAARRTDEAESRLADFWEASLALLAVLTPERRFVEVSGAWERLLGWQAEDLVGRSARDLIHPDDLRAPARPQMPEGAHPEALARFRAKDGSYRWLRWTIHETGDGALYVVAQDATAGQEVQEEARRQRALLDGAEELAQMGSWEIGFTTGERMSANMRRLHGLDESQARFRVLLQRVHPDDQEALRTAFAAGAEGVEADPPDYRVILPDGTERIMATHVRLIWADGHLPVGAHGTVHDVTESRETERRLRLSEARFEQGFDNAPIAMALTSAATGCFLRVNNAYCDMVGRTEEELLGMTWLEVLHPDDADRAERRLLIEQTRTSMVLEKRYLRPDGTIVWGSIHLSRVVDGEGNVDVLLAQSIDVTERRAQEEALRRQLTEVSWIGEIRAALLEDRFELHAQPIVDIASGAVVHHELLLRMRDPEGQLVPPDAFLPVAERFGDIREIDRWVVARGLELAAGGMPVAINLSGTSLGDRDLIGYIDGELARTGADPARIIFEITETALVESAETAAELGEGLRRRGCRFALDDFGTGYGGFHYLKTLSLDILKIDREFVRDAVDTESDRHLIWAVVSLAKGFGLQTIAEGVEDQATLELLGEMGVDQAQGYHLGRPAPIARLG